MLKTNEEAFETKEGFKKTKIGWIPEDWDIVRLGDIGEFKNGINKDKDQFGFGYPMINLNDIFELTRNGINLSLVNSTKNERRDYSLKKGDVLFVRSSVKPSGVGLTSLIEFDLKDTVFSGFIIRYRSSDLIADQFKAHCFNEYNFRKRLLRKSTISANTNINQVALKSLIVALPPLPEQKKIASILSDWDRAIENSLTLIEKLQLRKKGLMQQLLTGKTRLAGFSDEWKEDKLGNYFTERKETGHDDLQLLSVGRSGVYPQDTTEKKDTSNANKSKYKRICKGDIGYNTMRMWQGRSALSEIEGIVSPAYTILKAKENTNPVFFSYLFKLEEMIHKFYRNSQGMVSDTWMCKFKDLSIIKFLAPTSREEQTAIAEILTTSDKEIEKLQNYLEQLQVQKKGLMQQLLTGKIRVNAN